MEIYLVGGAVRDQLLGLPVTERDWVVVGATPQQMLSLGYRPVGKDFPVFLHPQTHEEYALARTERKVAKGYKGFKFHADPSVTLEADLKRRDLTVNAMAKSPDDRLIDPFGGQQDIANKTLRHVSAAFAEDPVRILRVARFAARFGEFNVAPETISLMQSMTKQGEVNALVAERVWQELDRTLTLAYPWRFFELLHQCQALIILFPEVAEHLPTITAILKHAVTVSAKAEIRFAAMLSSLSQQQIRALCKCNKVPNNYRDLASLVARYHENYYHAGQADAAALLTLLEQLDAFRRSARFNNFLITCRASFSEDTSQQRQKLQLAYQAAKKVSAQVLVDQGLEGEVIRQMLHAKRQQAIEEEIKCRRK